MVNCFPWKKKPQVATNSGQLAEEAAAKYLQQQGLTLITRNYRGPAGEIDLICKQQACWVFVEVKYRRSQHFGGGVAAITPAKIHRIVLTAEHYLQQHNINQHHCEIRFDVVSIQGNLKQIEWLSNAFGE